MADGEISGMDVAGRRHSAAQVADHDLNVLHGKTFAAVLADMDGTLLSSTASVNRCWTNWALERGLDPDRVLSMLHGVRATEVLAQLGVEDVAAEVERLTQMELDDVEGTCCIPGAIDFVAALPADRWAVVTSAPRSLALRRLLAAGFALPSVVVTAEDVERGKPAPDAYLLAAERLKVRSQDCLVLEDAAPGIAAGEAAGATVLVVVGAHNADLKISHPKVRDFTSIQIVVGESIEIKCRELDRDGA